MSNIWTDATGLLGTVAPMLASAIGGPLAGVATTAIVGALGLAPDTPPAKITAALASATPEQLLALKQADNAFAAQMKQLDVDFAKVSAGDRANARNRQETLHDRTPAILAYALTIGFFALVWLMVFHSVPEPNAAAVNILLGTLGTSWIAAMSYYFGSTQGSRAKTEMLFQSTPPASLAHQPAPIAQAIQVDAAGPSVSAIASAVEEARTAGEDEAHVAR